MKCPKCSAVKILFVEDVTQSRRIEGVTAEGEISVSGEIENETDGSNKRWLCDSCGHEWPIEKGSICFDEPAVCNHWETKPCIKCRRPITDPQLEDDERCAACADDQVHAPDCDLDEDCTCARRPFP